MSTITEDTTILKPTLDCSRMGFLLVMSLHFISLASEDMHQDLSYTT